MGSAASPVVSTTGTPTPTSRRRGTHPPTSRRRGTHPPTSRRRVHTTHVPTTGHTPTHVPTTGYTPPRSRRRGTHPPTSRRRGTHHPGPDDWVHTHPGPDDGFTRTTSRLRGTRPPRRLPSRCRERASRHRRGPVRHEVSVPAVGRPSADGRRRYLGSGRSPWTCTRADSAPASARPNAPSAFWIAITATVSPSSRSSVTHGAPPPNCTPTISAQSRPPGGQEVAHPQRRHGRHRPDRGIAPHHQATATPTARAQAVDDRPAAGSGSPCGSEIAPTVKITSAGHGHPDRDLASAARPEDGIRVLRRRRGRQPGAGITAGRRDVGDQDRAGARARTARP